MNIFPDNFWTKEDIDKMGGITITPELLELNGFKKYTIPMENYSYDEFYFPIYSLDGYTCMWLSINCSYVKNLSTGLMINIFSTYLEIATGNGIDETKEDESKFIYNADNNVQFEIPTMYMMEQIQRFINGLGYKWEFKK